MRLPSGYRPGAFRSFGDGLNLRDGADAVKESEAVDLLNVTFTERGAVAQRAGYGKFTSVAGGARYDSMSPFYTASGTKQLVLGRGNNVQALNTSGASVATVAAGSSPHFFARVGTPAAEYLYASNGVDTIRRWDGAAFSSPAGMPTAFYLTVDPKGNRLVAARTATNPSRVSFSDPGAPETWGANNYVDLTPGDGEPIMGITTWREYVIVFKETKFFIFHNNSTDTTGNPVFNYIPSVGAGLASSRALAASRDAVYFLSRNGVYRTTGRDAQKVSDIIEPFFLGNLSPFFTSSQLSHASITNSAMTFHEDRLYLAVTTGASAYNDRMLVFDPEHDWWSLYNIPASSLASFRVGSQEELMFSYATGTNNVGRHSTTYTADDATAISSHWRSGWYDYEDTRVKTIRESKLWGKGNLVLSLYSDFSDIASATVLDIGTTADAWGDGAGPDTWGSGASDTDLWSGATSLRPALTRTAQRGTVFSTKFENTQLNKTWIVHRLAHHIREQRVPTTTKA